MRLLIIGFICVACYACNTTPDLSGVSLKDLQGNPFLLNNLQNHRATAIYFLSPECPLCQNYTKTINELESTFEDQGIQFLGIFPGTWYSNEEIQEFKEKYRVTIPFYIDEEKRLVEELNATITPEVFLLNKAGAVIYKGKIDNWVNDLGKKKLEVNEKYLENAIIAHLNKQTIKPNKTEAVGCLIE